MFSCFFSSKFSRCGSCESVSAEKVSKWLAQICEKLTALNCRASMDDRIEEDAAPKSYRFEGVKCRIEHRHEAILLLFSCA